MKIKAVVFARVSTREQAEEGYSLQAQEKLVKGYAEKMNFSLNKIFSVPESARGSQERKLFYELIDYLYDHTDIKVVLCEKVDRITRNFKDAVRLDEWLNEDEERQIHFVKQSLIIHKNAKSSDKFMWDIYLAMAKQYSNNLSEEAKKGMLEKAEQGWFPDSHKRGYKTVGDMGRRTWVVDRSIPDARFIERAFEMYSKGNHTLRTISEQLFTDGWHDKNGKPIYLSELHSILSDCFYCGEFIWKDKHYPNAKHPVIISKDLFYLVQDMLHREFKSGKYKKHSFLFGGNLLVCGVCGRAVTWELQKGHHYGHCTQFKTECAQKKYIREEKVIEQVLDIFDSVKIKNPKILEWVRKALIESHQFETNYHTETVTDIETKKKQLEKRLDTLYDDRLDEIISKEFYDGKQKKFQEEIEALTESVNQHTKANFDYMKLGINVFELLQSGREIYDKRLLPQEKQELLHFLFSNLKLKDEKVVPTFHNGFQVVAERAKKGDWQGRRESNPRYRFWRSKSYH
ncbi:MAG: Recombinase [Candidatus Roizmanbacteria bacterium GW2011_GWA2_35_8]|uniref:Recombinase n=1 Tax=Candidatus Roizmanbacteria bacterium GW2011_GWA2_35_8 TaxID=1618479 RepID=A0A0G0DC54_9BACT|nr:MAG: Recombinase [Candidatus Roizmanbacteria bacterium GW2011_GWA2_35_8]